MTRDINKSTDALNFFQQGIDNTKRAIAGTDTIGYNFKDHTEKVEGLNRIQTRLHQTMKDYKTIAKSMEAPTMSLAQKFELFGMTMSGIAATIFVFQYIFTMFKGLVDLNNKLSESVEYLGQKYQMSAEQMKLTYNIARDIAKQTSLSHEEVIKYLDREMKKRQEFGTINMKKNLGMSIESLYD